MALKLDVSKAYDRIEWNFFRYILLRLGFANTLVNTIMLCVSSVSYSPYLFICCVEAFIKLVEDAATHGRLHGVRVAPSAPEISNLCFADDTVLSVRLKWLKQRK